MSEGGLEPPPVSASLNGYTMEGHRWCRIGELATLRTVRVHDKEFRITVMIAGEDDPYPIWRPDREKVTIFMSSIRRGAEELQTFTHNKIQISHVN